MSLLFVCASNPFDDAPHHHMAAFWLASRGHAVRMVCPGLDASNRLLTPLSEVQIEAIPRQAGAVGRLIWHMKLLVKLVRNRFSPRCPKHFYLESSVVCPAASIALAGMRSRKIIYHTQDFLEPGRHRLWSFFEKRIARKAAFVISNEPNRARFLASHYRLRQMPIVVPTALPKNWPWPERDQHLRNAMLAQVNRQDSDTCRLVMHEGGYSSARCGRQLVEAFRTLPEDFLFVFTSVTPNSPAAAELCQLIEQWRLHQRVITLERLSFADLLRHTACCDLGILLYPNDGLGNFYQAPGRLTHYIGCGLPVVASNFPGLELVILKHNLGRVCDPYSPQSIAEAIRTLGARPKAALAEHGRILRLRARNELAYEAHACQIEEILGKQGCL